jgi:phage shock protein A
VQRTFGDIDMLNEELAKLRNDVKGMRSRNTQYRSENDKLKVRIKELESKIEALI